MKTSAQRVVRRVLAGGHALLALILLLHLYGPWMLQRRAKEEAAQARIEEQARAGRWPQQGTIGFGPEGVSVMIPKEINAIAMADLPALIALGWGVVPSIHGQVLEQRPGWILPTTRLAVFIAIFTAGVWVQWWVLGGLLLGSLHRSFWWVLLVVLPLLCVPVALTSSSYHVGDWLRLGSLPYWAIMVRMLVAQSVRRRRSSRVHPPPEKSSP